MIKKLGIATLIIGVLSMTGCGSTYVQQGQVGLLVNNFSGQIEQVLQPGFRMTIPINKHIIAFPMIKQQYVMVRGVEGQVAEEDDSVGVNSLEGQSFAVDASVEYRLRDASVVPALYKKYGMEFDTIVGRYYRSKFRTAISQAFATLPLNEAVSGNGQKRAAKIALTQLQEDLSDDGIAVSEVLIRKPHIPEAISQSIAAKTQAENDLIRSRTTAQQQVVEAQAGAQAKLIRAKAEADSNRMINASLTGNLIRKMYVEKLSDKIQMVVPEKAFVNFSGLVPPIMEK